MLRNRSHRQTEDTVHVLDVRSMHGTELESGHYFVHANIKLKIKRMK